MFYRLLAMSVDHALLKSNGKLDRQTKEAIQFVKNKGVYVTLVTSRNFSSAHKIAKALKLDSHLITHNGAFIGSDVEEPIYEKRISEEDTIKIVEALEKVKCTIRIVHERFSIGNKFRHKSNLIARTAFSTSDPIFYPMQFVETLTETLRHSPVATPKMEIYAKEGTDVGLVKDIIHSVADVRIEEGPDGRLDVLPENVSKRKGLQILGEHLGIPLHEMVVIGDSMQDKEMIESAGLGVAMGNAPGEVKQASDWVTRSNNQHGVSYMVKEHFRKQLRTKMIKTYQ